MSMENDTYADLRLSIARAFPDAATAQNGIWETDHLDRIPWEKLTPPYAVICIAEFPEAEEGSADAACFMPLADIYLVLPTSGPLNALRDALSALKTDLMTNTFAAIEIWNVAGMEYGRRLEANEIFAAKRMPHQAGKITAQCLICDSY